MLNIIFFLIHLIYGFSLKILEFLHFKNIKKFKFNKSI